MKTNISNIKTQIAFFVGALLAHSLCYGITDENKSQLPESGPKISLESDENFADLGRACDLDNLQMEDASVSVNPSAKIKARKNLQNLPCQKLLEADKKFQEQMKRAKCESLDSYVPTEREIRICEINMRKSAGIGATRIQKYDEDIQNRDACIVKLQSNFCQSTANLNSLEE